MAIFDNNGKVLNILYVTPNNPATGPHKGAARYVTSAFIIDGKTYVRKPTSTNVVAASQWATTNSADTFQTVMNRQFPNTQSFVNFITTDGGQYQLYEP